MTASKRKIILGVLSIANLALAFFAWRSIFQAMFDDAASDWLVPILLFSGISALFLLQAVFVQPMLVRIANAILPLLPMFLFPFSIELGVAFVLGAFFLFRATSLVGLESANRVKVQVFSCARHGVVALVLAWSCAITGSYFTLLRDVPTERLLPKLSFSEGFGRTILRFAEKSNPGIARVSADNPTVDGFLLGFLSDPVSDSKGLIDPSLSGILENFGVSEEAMRDRLEEERRTVFLSEGRNKISDLLGRPVEGEERMLDVLSELANAKLFALSSMKYQNGDSSESLRGILALFLFLSLLSIGSLLGFLWALLAWTLFLFLRISGLVSIRTTLREVEEIGEI